MIYRKIRFSFTHCKATCVLGTTHCVYSRIDKNKQTKMKRITKALVQRLVKENNASGKISMSYLYENNKDNHNIHFANGVKLTFENSITAGKVFRILKFELGFEQDYNFQSDENDGIVQAALLGENPFTYSIMCSNPALNEVVK